MIPRKKPEPVEVLIIGAGASGGTAAKVFTEAGIRVVALDRGPFLRNEQFSGDELKYLNRNYVWPDPQLKPRTYRPDEESPEEEVQFSPTPQGVGGGTIHWGGIVPRMTEDDFRLRSLHGDIPGASLVDWPIEYGDLEPYYTRVEWELGTSGLAGANRWEGPRSKGYPTKPVELTHYGRVFAQAMKKMGQSTFPIPQAMVTEPYRGRNAHVNSGFWQQYGDPVGAKSSTANTFIPDALATGLLDLRPDCYVREIILHPDGTAKGAIYTDADGNEVEQLADIVICCAGAIETTRLLQLSKSASHANGLANSSGLLGANATFHEYLFAIGLFDKEVVDPLYPWAGHYMNTMSFDYYQTDYDRGHMLGTLIFASMLGHPVNWTFPGRPTWGQASKDADRDLFNHSMKLGVMVQDLPVESNRVDLDPNVVDAWELPVARITHTPHANDFAQAKWQVAKNMEILEVAGASKIIPVNLEKITGNCCHEMGTARMGNDPSKSVVDKWCQTHDVPNLYIFDGSFFPTSTGVNPTLTIMANAWRCTERIIHVRGKGRTAD
ncbi:GMC family oxidoreductase [Arthrobacter sp. FW306-2-2C-D06B]|uniref:GMC family oxidoreductase n=1 Tax=Arthrobacter sp. FW306-2-2C-D06B TaxID=2879618 RepID=UPI001F21F57B|nr:GMC family oxidoreductase [Arthrobacter sp. FW306-2-2C-D06B]UKA59442.1 GMC family oxidoreductase [Arthrobacter sp. FW306-2-2C-D06B]